MITRLTGSEVNTVWFENCSPNPVSPVLDDIRMVTLGKSVSLQ